MGGAEGSGAAAGWVIPTLLVGLPAIMVVLFVLAQLAGVAQQRFGLDVDDVADVAPRVGLQRAVDGTPVGFRFQPLDRDGGGLVPSRAERFIGLSPVVHDSTAAAGDLHRRADGLSRGDGPDETCALQIV